MDVRLTEQQLTTPLAEFELYGMTVREINLLESIGCIYVKDLEGIEVEDLLEPENGGDNFVYSVQYALRNFINGNQIKSIKACLAKG